jgi:pyrroloquinoline-quinone synthase
LIADRLAALAEHYPWIDREALAYFRGRPPQASRDSEHGLAVVIEYCRTLEDQHRAIDALEFKCDVLWAQLDAIYQQCVMQTRDCPP